MQDESAISLISQAVVLLQKALNKIGGAQQHYALPPSFPHNQNRPSFEQSTTSRYVTGALDGDRAILFGDDEGVDSAFGGHGSYFGRVGQYQGPQAPVGPSSTIPLVSPPAPPSVNVVYPPPLGTPPAR